ncbi:Abortive phage resistance protein [Flavobacterium anhuiense]|uniref:Abortive phage resistance protein n=1 Tax=Flavobacterium anhuiense TaxID=459526 RepID=A0A444W1G2_9FLAO|nr:RloB family protein [Flavobacterium anhuiense]RYJ39552.1 Abortive phage resistance protein [Flavobacterium anhuiense]
MTKRPKNKFKERELKSKVLILCEGLTEKNYFNALKEDLGLPKTIAVNVFQSNKVDCKGVVEEAIKKAKKEGFEEIFVVFDHDNQAKRDEAFKLAKTKNITVIFSSICFEGWYLLHYKNSTKAFTSEAELEKELKKCAGMENYEKNNFKHYSILKDKITTAKSNAEKSRITVVQNNEGTDVFDLNPFTNVDELVIYLENQKQ